jgi:hypothetical protein
MRAALLLLLCASAQAADVLGTVTTRAGRIDLYADAGHCVGNALLAEFTSATGKKVPGCWVAGQGVVQIAWSDGDVTQIDPRAIKRPESV